MVCSADCSRCLGSAWQVFFSGHHSHQLLLRYSLQLCHSGGAVCDLTSPLQTVFRHHAVGTGTIITTSLHISAAGSSTLRPSLSGPPTQVDFPSPDSAGSATSSLGDIGFPGTAEASPTPPASGSDPFSSPDASASTPAGQGTSPLSASPAATSWADGSTSSALQGSAGSSFGDNASPAASPQAGTSEASPSTAAEASSWCLQRCSSGDCQSTDLDGQVVVTSSCDQRLSQLWRNATLAEAAAAPAPAAALPSTSNGGAANAVALAALDGGVAVVSLEVGECLTLCGQVRCLPACCAVVRGCLNLSRLDVVQGQTSCQTACLLERAAPGCFAVKAPVSDAACLLAVFGW